MIEARAVVVRTTAATAWVRVDDRPSGCGRCNEPGGCGGARISYAFGRPNDVFQITCAAQFEAGDRVVLTIEDGAAIGAALATYGAPTAGAILGAGLGTWVAGDMGAAIGLLAGLLLSFQLARQCVASRPWKRRLAMSIRGDDGGGCLATAQRR